MSSEHNDNLVSLNVLMQISTCYLFNFQCALVSKGSTQEEENIMLATESSIAVEAMPVSYIFLNWLLKYFVSVDNNL